MGKKVPKAICLFGANFMLQEVHDLQSQIEGVQKGKDSEYVHQMRVASRRLRNGLDLFKECLPEKKGKIWRDDIRTITHALGNARDMDIQIAELTQLYEADLDTRYKPGYGRLLLRLKQNRTKAQKKINKTIFKLQEGKSLDAMTARFEKMLEKSDQAYLYTPSLYKKAFTEINDSLTDFLSYQGFIRTPDNIDKLHAMRIAGKHLRYTLEVFAPLYNGALDPYVIVMKDIQDQLGEFHDNDVWVSWLPKFIAQEQARIEDYFGNASPLKRLLPGLHFLMEDRLGARERAYQTFLILWNSIESEAIWPSLNALIRAPLNVEAALDHIVEEEEEVSEPEEGSDEEDSEVENEMDTEIPQPAPEPPTPEE